tara:strand:+ start:1056 stop:1496 length:441 start_codon:yes stop_codon:yes gene_type:complete
MMSNKKDWLYEKLNRLVKLSRATEPDQPDDKHLFQPSTIEAYDLLVEVEQRYDEMRPHEIREIMVEANKIWKFRKKIWNGDADWNWQSNLDSELADMIKAGAVINAIKYYRAECEKEVGSTPTLKESKDYVDKLRDTLNKTSGAVK